MSQGLADTWDDMLSHGILRVLDNLVWRAKQDLIECRDLDKMMAEEKARLILMRDQDAPAEPQKRKRE